VDGDVNWIKNPIGTKFYPAGFDFDSHASGSKYNAALRPLLDFSSGVLILTGGNLLNPITNVVAINGTRATGSNVTFSLNAAKGTFKGAFVNPPGKSKVPFTGVFLQNQDFGSGYFLGTGNSGSVFFGPAN
jgi:hypothetical protein